MLLLQFGELFLYTVLVFDDFLDYFGLHGLLRLAREVRTDP
jgi:hypothetical protein